MAKSVKDILTYAALAMQNAKDPNFANYTVHDDSVCLDMGCRRGAITSYWNPIDSNTDAFHTAVTLGFEIIIDNELNETTVYYGAGAGVCVMLAHNGAPQKATRMAISMAAAEKGKMA